MMEEDSYDKTRQDKTLTDRLIARATSLFNGSGENQPVYPRIWGRSQVQSADEITHLLSNETVTIPDDSQDNDKSKPDDTSFQRGPGN